MRAAHLHRRSVLARVAHVAGAVTLVTVAVAALLVGGTMTLLRTSWGGDLARRIGLRVANQRLAGQLEARRLRFGGDQLRLDDVVLRDPRGGAPVARVRRVEIGFRPLALLRGHVDLSRVLVVEPELHLALDADGSNLARALASRKPAARAPAPGEATSPSRLRVSLADLEVIDGLVDVQDRGAPVGAPLRHVRAEGVGGRVAGRLAMATATFEGRASLRARFESPAIGELALEAHARGEGERRTGGVTFSLAGSVVDATAQTRRDGGAVRLRRVHLTPALVRAVFPGVPLAAPLEIAGDAALSDGRLRSDARLSAGGGAIELRGELDVAGPRLRELVVDGHDVDLGRVVSGLPRSSFGFQVRARGAGRTVQSATGEASFTTSGGLLGGYALGPVRLRASLARGRLDLSELRAQLPGTTVTASGWARRRSLDLRASAEAADLGKTARSLGPAVAALGLTGRGNLALRASGSLSRPAFEARGQWASLSVGGVSTRELALRATLVGPRLKADLRMAAPQPLSLHVDGRVALARGALSLDALELSYPEARWRLVGPARMVFGTELLLVEGLDLRAGAQAIHVDLRRAGSDARVDGRVAVSGLDLARLPRIVQPRGQALGGRLDLRAQLSGTRRKPALEAHVALADGRVGETRDLALSLDVAASRARASGTFAARGLSTSARGTFDVPATWPPRDARAPVRVDLALEPSDLGALSRELRLPGPKLAGRAALSLQVRGTAGAPEARAEITTRGLVVGDAALGDPRVSLTAVRGAPTRLQVDVPKSAAAPMSGSVALETPASLHRLLFEPMSLEAALRTPFSARGELAGVPLSLIARALRLDAIRGTGALRLDVTGTPRELTGAVNAQVRGAASDAFPPTDARVDVALGRRDTRVAARVWRQGRQAPLVAMSAIWGTPAARLLAGRAAFEAAAASAPLDVRIYGGPVQLKHKTFITSKEGSPAGDLHASARVTAEITGTLRQPVVEAVGDVSRARVGNQDVGDARVRLRYADAQAKLTARAQSAGGGTLQLDATAHADLGYPRVAALDPDHLPVEASLEARAFDLAWLSGLTGAVSRVAGKLDASVDLRGALRDPALAGRVEWKDGALAVTEIGEYRDVHVAVHAGNGRITIDDVRASSGSGTARLTGDATRAPDGHLVVSANAQLSRFPIYGQGEVLGTLSTRLALRANASLAGAKGRLEIEEAKAELGQLRRKDVQSLDRPANVVLVAGGRPINEEEKKKLIALEASRRARDGKGALPAGGDAGPPPWEAEVQVVAPRNLWVRGQDAELELGLSEGFRIEVGPALRMFGAISVRRGTVSVLGRRFTLQKDSTVTFHGPPEEPSLDIVARHENERAKVAVNVTVRGTPEDLRIDVSSPDRPDLNQTQLYSLIVTGQLDVGERSTAGATSLSNEAASLVGGLLASSIQKTLRKRLPLDVLTIQAGTGLTGSRLEAGTYIGSRLYVGYVGRVGSDPILLQNRNAVRVEYQFSPRWSLDAEYGDVGTGIADLLWNKHY